jgi:hypothetical protein
MANLNSAVQALKAELMHAKQGMEYYTSRMEALQQTLEQLERVDAASPGRSTPTSKTRSASAGRQQERTKRGRKPRAAAAGSATGSLPSTAGEFWPSLISAREISAPEILEAAIAKLGITPTAEQRKKLSNRMVAALNHMVQSKAISDTGSGRARRYFRVSH